MNRLQGLSERYHEIVNPLVPDALDIIVRFDDLIRISELKRALLSIVCQAYRPITVQLVTSQPDELTAALAPTLALDKTVKLQTPPAALTSPYLAFLNCDGVIHPHAYSHLIADLKEIDCAIAFGGINKKSIDIFEDTLLVQNKIPAPPANLIDLFEDDIFPPHSFVINRNYFQASQETIADYDFLLRLCAEHPSSFRLTTKIVGDYYINKNTKTTAKSLLGLKRSQFLSQSTKQSCFLSEAVQRQLGVFSALRPLTIAEAVQRYGLGML